jgi:HSP20 family protein
MAEPTKLPVKTERSSAPSAQPWRPFESLHREIDRLFEDLNGGFWRSPFHTPTFDLLPTSWAIAPAVDFTDTEKAYELERIPFSLTYIRRG